MKIKRDSNLDNLSTLENNIAKLYRTNIIQPLKGFCRVVEEGNLSRAAEKYGVTPGLLTKQIKVIENQLGIELFNRDNNCRIFPNEAGLKFYDRASKIISQLENLVVEFSEEMNDEESKILRVGASPFMLSKIFPFISEFKDKNKDIEVKIFTESRDSLKNKLINGELDILLSSKELSENIDPKLDFIELVDYVPYWVLWKGHPLESKNELTKDDVINGGISFSIEDITMNSLKTFIKDNNIKSAVCINKCGLDTQKDMIKSKLGIWVIFNIFLKEDDKKYFIFKNASNLFPIGKSGCFINKTHKKVIDKFIEGLVAEKQKLFNFDFLEK